MAQERRLRRFFSSVPLPPPGGSFQLGSEEVYHLKQILRLEPGDECLVTDGKGREVRAVIRRFNENGTAALETCEEAFPASTPSRIPEIRIFQAIPRGDRFEFLIQKAQELDLAALVPVVTARTVVQIPQKKVPSKLDRWHRIAREAAKQSGSRHLLSIHPPVPLGDTGSLIAASEEVALFHPGGKIRFRTWIKDLEAETEARRINLFLGPEGGFSNAEINWFHEEAKARNWRLSVVDLGSTILRAETAFLAVASSLKLFLQENEHD